MVERMVRIHKVRGSIPLISTNTIKIRLNIAFERVLFLIYK